MEIDAGVLDRRINIHLSLDEAQRFINDLDDGLWNEFETQKRIKSLIDPISKFLRTKKSKYGEKHVVQTSRTNDSNN